MATNEPVWEWLGRPAPEELSDARVQAHWAGQVVMSAGDHLLERAPDDSHTSMEWLPGPRLLAGKPIGPARAALRIADLTLLVLGPGDRPVAERPLHGTTLAAGCAWLGDAIAAASGRTLARPLTHRDYDMPAHPVAAGAPFDRGEGAAFAELARWYGNADGVLRRLAAATAGATPVACWPHHFDVATLIVLGEGREIGVGLSPGDHYYAQPYWYVNAHPIRDGVALPTLAGRGAWHRTDWLGAVLPGAALAGAESAEAQLAQTEAFLASAVRGCRTLIGLD